MNPSPERLRVAAVGDLHVGEDDVRPYADLFAEVSETADVAVLCGDLTNHGKLREAEILADDVAGCRVPVLGVLGNHDYECGRSAEVAELLRAAGMRLLDGQPTVIDGVGFAGCKGFVGGFGRAMLSAFGEPELKTFVQASIDESLKLEASLRMLRTDRTVVVLHYAPVPDTLVGEPLEIYPFLGCSRLGETVDRFDNVSLVLHGHAHKGSREGVTPRGRPVRNVARPLLSRETDRSFAVFEV